MSKAWKLLVAVLFAGSLLAAGCTEDATPFGPDAVLETGYSGYAIANGAMNLPTSLPGTDTTTTTPTTK